MTFKRVFLITIIVTTLITRTIDAVNAAQQSLHAENLQEGLAQEPENPTPQPTTEAIRSPYQVFLPAVVYLNTAEERRPPRRTPTPTPTSQPPTSMPTQPTATPITSTPTPVTPTATPNPSTLTCKFTITPSTALIDGRAAPYNTILPGDTICVASGTRGSLNFRNLRGSLEHPINIVNSGGKVIFNTSSGYGMSFYNSQHFRLTGTGSADTYGFLIQKSLTFGVFLTAKTEYFEIDHLEVTEVLGGSLAFHAITHASCPTPNGRNSDDYDYNGDGRYDAQDAVSRSNFTQHNFVFHDNYVHGFRRPDQSVSINMAYYLGNSNYSDPVYTRSCTNADGTTTPNVTVVNPVIEGVRIYKTANTTLADKVLQVGSAVKDCSINDNTIDQGGLTVTSDVMGININPGSVCDVYNNRITNVFGHGIAYAGDGGRIYNNLIANIGRAGSYYHTGIHVSIRPDTYHHDKNTHIFNNTIVNTVGYGVAFGHSEGSDNRIQNNLIVNAGYGYISRPSGSFTVSNNYQTANLADVRFVDPANGNYYLQSSSPAINTGFDLTPYGILFDLLNLPRPANGAFDIGAYEYR